MPESVAHDGDAWRPGVVLRFQKAAAPRWRDGKCTEQAGCNELRTNAFRRGALYRERHPAPDERGKLRERVILCAPVEEVRERDRDLVTATRLAHRDQPVRVDVGERSEKRCAQYRKTAVVLATPSAMMSAARTVNDGDRRSDRMAKRAWKRTRSSIWLASVRETPTETLAPSRTLESANG